MRYHLTTELGNDILHVGTKEECEMIRSSFVIYGIPERKFILEPMPEDKWMTDITREKIKTWLEVEFRSTMFGDGLEYEYIRDGVTIVGLNDKSDEELYNDFHSCNNHLDCDDFSEEDYPGEGTTHELFIEVEAQYAIHTMVLK